MKTIILILTCLSVSLYSQTKKALDTRAQLEKEDSNDLYNQSKITTLDLLEALDLASIRIHKFKIGTFDKEFKIQILADEYINGELIKSDTLLDIINDYGFWVNGEYNQGFIDQIKIFTKTEDNNSILRIRTYSLTTQKEITLAKSDERQFFIWREYKDTHWTLNKKTPLLIYASSWLDKKYNIQRFCGVVKLKENDEKTIELLTSSPNYIIVSYIVTATK